MYIHVLKKLLWLWRQVNNRKAVWICSNAVSMAFSCSVFWITSIISKSYGRQLRVAKTSQQVWPPVYQNFFRTSEEVLIEEELQFESWPNTCLASFTYSVWRCYGKLSLLLQNTWQSWQSSLLSIHAIVVKSTGFWYKIMVSLSL